MKKLLFFVSLAALFAAFTACQKEKKTTDRTFKTGDTLFVKMDETVILLPDGLEIRLDSITSEFRCPSDVDCIWQGAAFAKLTFSQNGESETGLVGTFGLHSGPVDSLKTFDFRVKMTDLTPYPLESQNIPQAEYEAMLVVEKI